MKKISLAFLLLGSFAISCQDKKAEDAVLEQPETTEQTIEATTTQAAPAQDQQQMVVEQPQQAAPVIQQQPQQAPNVGKTEPGFSGKPNPAHGQPGHRCDIQVGAILP